MKSSRQDPDAKLPKPGLIRNLLPNFIAVEEGPFLEDEQGLYPEELERIINAVPRRRLEYATGRVFARRALTHLGAAQSPILQGAAGDPIWPDGFRGSITHCAGYCAVAVARLPEVQAIGIDIERVGRISSSTIAHIATKREVREILSQLPPDQAQGVATVLFSAKEALFKSRFQLGTAIQRMSEVELELDMPAGKFQPFGSVEGSGHFSFSENFVGAAWLV